MIKKVKIKKFNGKNCYETEDYVAVENIYKVFINGEFIKSHSISPNFLEEFSVGFAISEGFLSKVKKVKVEDNNIYIFGEKNKKTKDKNKPKIDIETIKKIISKDKNKPKIDIETIKKIISYELKTENWEITGGFHWASLFNLNGDNIIFIEDIGRYNAVDKVIGYAILHNYNLNNLVLRYSGRIFHDIVKKAVNSGLKVIISKSPPTDKAINLAEKENILLIGFARNGKFNIYTSGGLWEE